MSNVITIKHGVNVPSNGKLQPFELGYVTSTGTLVIGEPDGLGTNTNTNTKSLNYLQLDSNGYIPVLYSNGNLTLKSTAANPKLWIEATKKGSKCTYGMTGNSGQAYILEYAPDSEYYERYELPEPSKNLTDDIDYTILTTKGGTFAGNFTFSGKLTANGAIIIVDDSSYGTKDPNTAGTNGAALSGTTGQLYFVIAE